MKTLITFTDGGSREKIQRSILSTIQSEFELMVAVGVGPLARDEELRLLSTKGRSIHVSEYEGERNISTIDSKYDICYKMTINNI